MGAWGPIDKALLSMARLPETLQAGPVELRRWRLEHLDALIDAVTTSLPELSVWMPWAKETPRRDEYGTVLRGFEASFDAGTEFVYGMFESGSDVVGGCGLHLRGAPVVVEVGYWVRTDRQRRGYATAAARALTTAAFEHLDGVDEVHITMDEANAASARVPSKLRYRLHTEEEREVLAPGHTGRGFRWVVERATWP